MIKEDLIGILETFCDDVYLQGTYDEKADYPSRLITFFITDAPFSAFYDDDPNYVNWYINVMFYSKDPQEVMDIPPQIIRTLKSEGYIPQGAGNDIISDDKDLTGWAMEFVFIEHITK